MANAAFTVNKNRQFAFYNPGAGYMDTASKTLDWLEIGAIQLAGIGGVALDANGARIANVGAPTQDSDSATKSYVDNLISGVSWELPCDVATTGPIANLGSSGSPLVATDGGVDEPTIDGLVLSDSHRVLVKDGASPDGVAAVSNARNGVYVLRTGPLGTPGPGQYHYWYERAEAPTAGSAVFVKSGAVNADCGFTCTNNDFITLNSTLVTYVQFTGLGQVLAGGGVTKTGNTLAVDPGNGIVVDGYGVSINLTNVTPGTTFESALNLTGSAGTQKLEWKPDSTRGLNKDAAGAYLVLASNSGLEFSGGGVAAKVSTSQRGLATDASGLYVAVTANAGLQFSGGATGTLGLKLRGSYGLAMDTNGLYVDLATTNPGLQFATGKLDVKYDSARAITAGASGIGVNVAASSGLQIASNALTLKLRGNYGLVQDSNGLYISLAGTNPSLLFNGSGQLDVKYDANGGLQASASGAQVKVASTDRLSIGASGLDVVGLPIQFEIGGVACSNNVTAGNLGTLTGGASINADTLHGHKLSKSIAFSGDAIAVGAGVYFSGDNAGTPIVSAGSCNTAGKDNIIGICSLAAGAGGAATSYIRWGTAVDVLSGATIGAAYYLGPTGTPVLASALASGNRVIRLGYAINATDLDVRIQDIGVRP
jgi:hypothetical protein